MRPRGQNSPQAFQLKYSPAPCSSSVWAKTCCQLLYQILAVCYRLQKPENHRYIFYTFPIVECWICQLSVCHNFLSLHIEKLQQYTLDYRLLSDDPFVKGKATTSERYPVFIGVPSFQPHVVALASLREVKCLQSSV